MVSVAAPTDLTKAENGAKLDLFFQPTTGTYCHRQGVIEAITTVPFTVADPANWALMLIGIAAVSARRHRYAQGEGAAHSCASNAWRRCRGARDGLKPHASTHLPAGPRLFPARCCQAFRKEFHVSGRPCVNVQRDVALIASRIPQPLSSSAASLW